MLKNYRKTCLIKKIMRFLMKLATLIEIRIKARKSTSSIRFQLITIAKTICRIQHSHKKKQTQKKMVTKMEKCCKN